MIHCTVIIPVYNAFPEAKRCLESVILHLPPWANVLVIDDCSPSGDFKSSLPESLQKQPSVSFLKNEKNLGFVGSCNRGMLLYAEGDVVLLNSDTIATAHWLEKLRQAAYIRPRTGTVTPLTNNGTIASVPRFLENNSIPESYSLETFSSLVEKVSAKQYPTLPTCVGFCTYIRRELLSEVGGFDPEFGKGYGEENDLSLRGTVKGFLNILDDATFIYHEGSMSFAEMKASLSAGNAEKLSARYPGYNAEVASFCQQNPLREVHDRIWNPLQAGWISQRNRTVLHILHNGPYLPRRHAIGGTELHVQSIIDKDRSCAHFSLTPHGEVLHLTAHTPYGDRDITLPASFDLACLLTRNYFDIVHVHHTLGFNLETLADALYIHGNYTVSIHDYWFICDKIFLQAKDDSVCDGMQCHFSCENEKGGVLHKRTVAKELLQSAKQIITFSDSTSKILQRTLQVDSKIIKIPHGISLPPRMPCAAIPAADPADPVRVLFLGTLAKHKGLSLLASLCQSLHLPGGRKVAWHFIGAGDDAMENLVSHGRYTPETLQGMIASVKPHCAIMLSQCQETYSMTLDEIVWCGIPIVVTPYGAPPERVKTWGVGVVAENSREGILHAIESLVTDKERYLSTCTNTQKAPIITLSEEIHQYSKLYGELCPQGMTSPDALMKFLQPGLA